MKFSIHILFFLIATSAFAQDKLFLRNGNTIYCKVVSIAENTISYKDTLGNPAITTIPKADVLIADKLGLVFIFGSKQQDQLVVSDNETPEQRRERKMKEWKQKEGGYSNSILGFYISELALGRLSVSYEYLFANKSIGVLIPVSLSYDPTSIIRASGTNTYTGTTTPRPRNTGVGFISGMDINYYYDLKPGLKYYFGPRFRYGRDILLGGIEGLTFQLQSGIFKCSSKKTTSNFGIGVGFFKLSAKYFNYGYEPKQVYPWASFTWRLGFRL